MSIRLILLLFPLLALAAPPDLSGRWKRIEERMSIKGPHDLTLTIRHKDPAYYQKAEGVMGMSTPFLEVLECETNAVERPQAGQLGASAQWEGATLVVRYVKDGRPVATARLVLLDGGKRLKRDVTFQGRPPISETYVRQ